MTGASQPGPPSGGPVAGATSPAVPNRAVSALPMWVLGCTFMVDSLDQNVIRGLIPQLRAHFGVGDVAIGLLMSAFVLVNGLITLPAGYLADRWRRTKAASAAMTVWSGVSAACAAAPTFGALVVLRGALGFGQGVTDPSASSLIPDYYVLGRRGRAFSVQQSLAFVGTGVGVLIGGLVGPAFGWRAALVVASLPGLLVAAALWRLPEPVRGAADRVQVGATDHLELVDPTAPRAPLFDQGVRSFMADLARGVGRDVRVIVSIPTLRFALAGVSAVLFVLTAVASWMTVFYQRQLGLTQGQATVAFLVMVVAGGIPGVIVGGRVADRLVTRITGARVVLPGVELTVATTCLIVSLINLPLAACLPLQLIGFFFATSAVPALRAGLTDAVPSNLRGTGFGTFNLVSVVCGTAAAPLITAYFAQRFGGDLRTAFLIVLPLAYPGAALLFAARRHLEADSLRLLAVVAQAAEEQHHPA